MNATEQTQHYRVLATGLPRMAQDLRRDAVVGSAGAEWVALAVRVPPDVAAQAGPGSHAMNFEIAQMPDSPTTPERRVVEKSTFMVPR